MDGAAQQSEGEGMETGVVNTRYKGLDQAVGNREGEE